MACRGKGWAAGQVCPESLERCVCALALEESRSGLRLPQGIYLNEHRNYGGPRSVVVTLQGVRRQDGRRYSEHL